MSTRSRIAKPLRGQVLPAPCGGATFACHTPSRRKTVTLYALWSKGRRRTTPRRTLVANVWHVCFLQTRRESYYAQCTGRFRLTIWLQGCQALLSSTRLCQCTCGRAPATTVRTLRCCPKKRSAHESQIYSGTACVRTTGRSILRRSATRPWAYPRAMSARTSA